MFSIAIPISLLVLLVFVTAVLVAGVALFLIGRRRGISPVKWIGGLLVGLVLLAGVAEFILDAALEWNPDIAADSDITGLWKDDDQRLTLSPDHTYIYEFQGHTRHGTWTRAHWNLSLREGTSTHEMRFVQYFGKYRLMTLPPLDPDLWDGDPGLKHISP